MSDLQAQLELIRTKLINPDDAYTNRELRLSAFGSWEIIVPARGQGFCDQVIVRGESIEELVSWLDCLP